ncbi:MAG: 23S rRNA (uracil(1939)-C(5))-methyltransferase RlmD [Gammaproteobacteria bacterium]|nr:23S rRNA (uracil(1939)-C(5))-methyltransferase RlmD [Gammaproteobacteria bacterium]
MKKERQSGEEAIATISKLSHEGRGIAFIEGKATFINNALPGEEVKFRYTRRKSQLDEGHLVEVISASPDRVEPPCAVFGRCGGCSLQHIAPAAQIQFKQTVLAEQFLHFGQVSPEKWLEPLQAAIWAYRQKGRLSVKFVAKKGGALVGFREQDPRFITDMQRCEVLHPLIGERIHLLREWISSLDAASEIPQLEVAVDDHRAATIIRHLEPLSEKDLLSINEFAKLHDFWMYLQPKGPDTVHLVYPEQVDDLLSYSLPEHKIEMQFHPSDFTQVNMSLNRQMLNLAIELLDIQATDKILDLFCGLGNFTLPLARYAKHVVGVEGDAKMTERAGLNAKRNQLDNVEFFAANLFEDVSKQDFMQQTYDKILLDPPRAGAEQIILQLGALKAKRIVYISCNPATLARDAGILVNKLGYKLEQAGVMDMFPHTSHVESIALFTK